MYIQKRKSNDEKNILEQWYWKPRKLLTRVRYI